MTPGLWLETQEGKVEFYERSGAHVKVGNRNNGQIDMRINAQTSLRINAQTILRIYAQIIFTLRNKAQIIFHAFFAN